MDGYEAFSTSLTPNFEKFGSKKVKNLSLAGEMDPPPSFRELVEFRCAQCKVRETLQKRLRAMKWRRGDFYWGSPTHHDRKAVAPIVIRCKRDWVGFQEYRAAEPPNFRVITI